MSKLKKRFKALSARSQKHKRFILFDYEQIESQAFRYLTGGALKLLIMVRKRFNGFNNGEISFSVREGRKLLGYSLNTVARYFDELVDKGFLRIKEKGSFTYKKRHATTWIITCEEYNHQKSRDFKHWIKTDRKK
jgi:Fic family protein